MNQAQNLKPNKDIRDILQKYKITYVELLEFIPNFSHVQRIYEELNKPLTEERVINLINNS